MQGQAKPKMKRSWLEIVLFVLIMTTVVTASITSSTFAKFVTEETFTGETPVSNWGFHLRVNGYVDGEAGDTNAAASIVSGMNLATAKDSVRNTDANAFIKNGTVAFGSEGYMPVEIKYVADHASEVSLLITVKAYFTDLPSGMLFTDNLGRTVARQENAKGYTFTDVQYAGRPMTSVTYSYFLGYDEMEHWTDGEYINIGFRWAWKNDENSSNEKPDIGTAVVVTAEQVLSEIEIPDDARKIHFANALTDDAEHDKYGLVLDDADTLNILTADLGDVTIEPTADFYLDVNGKGLETSTYDFKIGTGVDKVVAGTFRRPNVDYTDTTKRPAITVNTVDSAATSTASVKISKDFQYAYADINSYDYKVDYLVDVLNGVLSEQKKPTPYDALTYVIDHKTASTFAVYTDAEEVTDFDSLVSLIENRGDENNYILWDSESKYFVAFLGNEYAVTDTTKGILSVGADYSLFKMYSAVPATQTYSVYLTGDSITGDIDDLTVGLDVGNNDGITSITYDRSTATSARNVLIRTNAFSTVLTVNGYVKSTDHSKGDVVYHYGMAGMVDVIQCATASYDEYGIVGRLTATASGAVAHIEIKEGAKVFQVEQSVGATTTVTVEENATVYDIEGKKVSEYVHASATKFTASNTEEGNRKETITAAECQHENGLSVMSDEMHVYEFCKTCGYTVIRIKNTTTQEEVIKTISNGDENVIIPKATYSMNQTTEDFDDLVDDLAEGTIDISTLVQDKTSDTETTGTAVVPAVEQTPEVSDVIDITCEHEFGTMEVITEATALAVGQGKFTCIHCGLFYFVVIPKEEQNPYAVIENIGSVALGNTAATDDIPTLIASYGNVNTEIYNATLVAGSGSCMKHGKDTTFENVWEYSALLDDYTTQQIEEYFGDYTYLSYVITFDKDVSYHGGDGNLLYFCGSLNGGQWQTSLPVVANYNASEYENEITKYYHIYYAEYLRTEDSVGNAQYTEEFAINAYTAVIINEDDSNEDYLNFCIAVEEAMEGSGADSVYVNNCVMAQIYNFKANTEYTFTENKILSLSSVLTGSKFKCTAALMDLDGSNDEITMSIMLYGYKSKADAVAISSDRKLANVISFTFEADGE